MTGPEHYRQAERLLSDASFSDSYGNPCQRSGTLMNSATHIALIQRAQVHAMLAQTAATVAYGIDVGDTSAAAQWADILWPDDGPDPDDQLSNAGVFTETELYEMDRDAELAHDAAADAENTALVEAEEGNR